MELSILKGLAWFGVLAVAGCDGSAAGSGNDAGARADAGGVVDVDGGATDDAGSPPPDRDGGPPTGYPYFDMLASHPNAVLAKAFRTQQEIEDTYIDPSSDAHVAGKWVYDPVIDAARLRWDPNEASLSAGQQLRWGSTPGYREPVPTAFGTLGTGSFLFVWEWRFDSHWAISSRDMTIPEVMVNHKAFQAARDDDITIEPRFRYTGASAQFPAPTGNQVCHLDVRTYVGGSAGAPGDGFPQMATIYPEPEQWFRLFLFLDGESLQVSFWGQIEGGPLVQMLDRVGGITGVDQFRGIDAFWIELNSSQEGGSGISEESYGWGRNWVVLSGLTFTEAEELVSLSSW